MKFFAFSTVLAVASHGVTGFAPSLTKARSLAVTMMGTVENDATSDVKVGVIGAGRIGLVHLEAITKAPGVTPIIISNPTVSKAEKGTSMREALLFPKDDGSS